MLSLSKPGCIIWFRKSKHRLTCLAKILRPIEEGYYCMSMARHVQVMQHAAFITYDTKPIIFKQATGYSHYAQAAYVTNNITALPLSFATNPNPPSHC